MNQKRTWVNADDPTLASTICGVTFLFGLIIFFIWLGITK